MKQIVIIQMLFLLAFSSCTDNSTSEVLVHLFEKIEEARFLLDNSTEAPILGEIAPGSKAQLQKEIDWANFIVSNSSNDEAYQNAILELNKAMTAFDSNRVKAGFPLFSKGSYIYPGNVSELIDKNQFSIVCKIKLTDLQCDEASNLGNFITSDKDGKSVIFRYTSAGAIHAYIYANGWMGAVTTEDILKVNCWYNIAFTFDGKRIIIYQDGKEVASTVFDNTISAEIANDAPFHIGAAPETRNRSMHGYIVNVSFWKKALDVSEINDLISNEISESQPYLSAFWPFALNLGNLIPDNTEQLTAEAVDVEWVNE